MFPNTEKSCVTSPDLLLVCSKGRIANGGWGCDLAEKAGGGYCMLKNPHLASFFSQVTPIPPFAMCLGRSEIIHKYINTIKQT